MLHRLAKILFPRIELNRLRRELEEIRNDRDAYSAAYTQLKLMKNLKISDLEHKVENRNNYIQQLQQRIKGYKSENTKLKNIIKNHNLKQEV